MDDRLGFILKEAWLRGGVGWGGGSTGFWGHLCSILCVGGVGGPLSSYLICDLV